MRFPAHQNPPSSNRRLHLRRHPETPGGDVHESFPFDLLPLELQVEIFSHCLPLFPHFNVEEAPFLITRVCKTWRDLAYNTPKLWSTFEIEVIGSGMSLHDVKIINTIQLWLERSKAVPLNVRIIHVPVGRIPDPRSARILSLLVPEARRWKHVEFIVPSSSMSSIQNSLPDGFPELRSLTLQMKDLWSSEPSFDLSSMRIPWHQLTGLDLRLENGNLLDLGRCLEILSQAERLAAFTATVNCVLDLQDPPSEELSMPALQTLHLIPRGGVGVAPMNGSPEACLVKFLNLPSLPAMHTLRIEWLLFSNDATSPWPTTHLDFLSFLHDVSPTIRAIDFAYLPVTEIELMECLSQVPELTDLVLRFSLSDLEHDPITDHLFSACTHPSPSVSHDTTLNGGAESRTTTSSSSSIHTTPLLPVLENWNIQCHGKRYTHTSLLSMLASRQVKRGNTSHTRLESFHLLSMNSVPQAVQRRVQAWSDEGLDISIDSLIIR
ncbi:hypothetical protein M413DRAFT_26783 [Hebeloma cylindrosporum]|uniref:Uncharacterized protein n=1 Tax=Hebeloma cylindrosporum TaxID=76867 RepID=A0A0C3C1L4_HEBCY|nr:hypothetical protein M413DRAFT_26783 [Hebeloma cylindrosporum h7]